MGEHIPFALYLRGKAQSGLGNHGQARKSFYKALAAAEDNQLHSIQWRILHNLSQYEDNSYTALNLHQRAQETIEFIATNISDPELRTTFLSQAEIREVLE